MNLLMLTHVRVRFVVICVCIHYALSTSIPTKLLLYRCWIKVINNCQALDKGTLALGLCKDLQEGVLFL